MASFVITVFQKTKQKHFNWNQMIYKWKPCLSLQTTVFICTLFFRLDNRNIWLIGAILYYQYTAILYYWLDPNLQTDILLLGNQT